MAKVTVRLPDGEERQYEAGITPLQILREWRPELEAEVLLAEVNGTPFDLFRPLPEGEVTLRFLTFNDPPARDAYRHTTAHILAQAVKELFPEAKLAIGPPIEDGFYYDFDVPRPFTPEDLERIEAKMREIVAADYRLERLELPKDEARKLLEQMGETYKLEILDGLPGETVSFYRQDGFIDLVQRTAHPQHRTGEGAEVAEHLRGLLAGRRAQPDAPAHLRHLLPDGRAIARAPEAVGRSPAA